MATEGKIFATPGWLACGTCGCAMSTGRAQRDGTIPGVQCRNQLCSEFAKKYTVSMPTVAAVREEG